jgi:hypothetical protein
VMVNSSADRRLPRALPQWALAFAQIAASH